MMSTCSDNLSRPMPIPVRAFEYPHVFAEVELPDETVPSVECELAPEPELPNLRMHAVEITQEDLNAAYERGRQEGHREAEVRSAERIEHATSVERSKVQKIIDEFQESTAGYYHDLEEQAVHLSLAIAGKILHRETQVDPLLLAALVKVATENIRQGSHVQVSINPSEIDAWREYFDKNANKRIKVELVPDAKLHTGDCVVHSEVGSAALGISAQLKEIERGLFDLLAQRPKNE